MALFQGTRKQGQAPAQEMGPAQGGAGQEAREHGQDPLAWTRCDSEDPVGWAMNLILDSSGESDKAAKAGPEPRELIRAVIQLLPDSAEAQGKRCPANPKPEQCKTYQKKRNRPANPKPKHCKTYNTKVPLMV